MRRFRKKRAKNGEWTLTKADAAFSKIVIERDKRCLYPGCKITDPKKLTCSHYIGRANKSTRYSLDNCITLCRNHHYWDKQLGFEFQKQTVDKHGWDGRYTLFMQDWLGKDRYSHLMSVSIIRYTQKRAIKEFVDNFINRTTGGV